MRVTLYHGSDVAIERPDVTLSTGFSDLGRGFYLTDDREVACGRARSRARRTGAAGVVSAFDLNLDGLPWVQLGMQGQGTVSQPPACPFGLCFDEGAEGMRAWVGYIMACRRGATALEGLGEPAIVRAWIATEEVEMACSGLADIEDVVACIGPSDLVVQYCLRDQAVADARLAFVNAEVVTRG